MTDSQRTLRSDFIEMVGLIAQDEGLPRISGRIMGLLLFDGRPYSFGEIAIELRVSRGSISANTRMLSERGVIRKVAKPGDRQDYYQIEDDPYREVLKGVAERSKRNAARIREIEAKIDKADKGRSKRLKDYAGFYEAISKGIGKASST
ncbi:HTH-type transcriptional regulator MmpR5 [Defluviimonas aquaemixtae]|uniref:HTH-type transcriptional regulator MmpR5 n=1 Tax=Albidovulum aquaemixtae TaxID=1542388 RepID=A0A2R8BNB3_9RHOB|nr:transcriptional regulator [Defluviimonas aquaemixtae]SPH24937.1 HTH-type transcriptional regulator MmpR5 [Defluviimonas aquaemixtae]